MNRFLFLRALGMRLFVLSFVTAPLFAHPITFNSTITYSNAPPSGGVAGISNWVGAAFDAGNIGGSGINADGGANNGTNNDVYTYVANNQPVQGQTFVTGNASNGYDLASITVRMAGYTNNLATVGGNDTAWNLNPVNGPITVGIGKVVSGTNFMIQSFQNFTAGATGNPGAGDSSNGPGTFITFNLPFPVHLDPNNSYAFDFSLGGNNYFEWLGTRADSYPGGTACQRNGLTITPLAGDRVFMLNLTPSASAPAAFAHPGALHTQADLDRMKARVAANAQPWLSDYNLLVASKYAQLSWGPHAVTTIVRGDPASYVNNYTRSQEDAVAIYELALRYYMTGNTAYADQAVVIANAWANTLTGFGGDSNWALGAGLCGKQLAIAGELLSGYPGWAAADKQAFKDMMMRVVYPANFDFMWRQNWTFTTKGGNTHYRLNWDTCNAAAVVAVGILCDNRAVYQQGLDYFKCGASEINIQRAAWYMHPDGTASTEEVGRDQGHNLGGWLHMVELCQMAWNQGDDLYGYDNNRALRAFEYNAKYNLGYAVPVALHRNCDLTYTEGLAGAYPSFDPTYETVYNHYVNEKGIAAPYSKMAADLMRPEAAPNTSIHPSQVDWMGLGTLTYTRDPIAAGVAPSGLHANWSKNQITLNWWGSAYATGYNVKRAATNGGPYAIIGSAASLDTTFSDTSVTNGGTYYYVVSAVTNGGETANSPELMVNQALVTRYTFDGSPNDAVGTRHATLQGGSGGAPTYAAGKVGAQAISLNGTDQYVQMPAGVANYQDITLSAWVYWNGGGAWQRIFDIGSEIEASLFLTPSSGSKMVFNITTTRGNEGTGVLQAPIMATNQWVHVAVTLNGDTGTLYVNGVPVDTETIDQVDPLFSQVFCYLGKSMYNTDPLFNGRIDDFRIYNYALSGADIWTLWGQNTNKPPVFASDPMTRAIATEDVNYSGSVQTLAGAASDPEGGALVYAKAAGPAWLVVATNGVLSGTPGNSDVGTNMFVVRVTDPATASDDATLKIIVTNVNDAPTWATNVLSRSDVSRDRAYSGSLVGAATDIDAGDTITYSKVGGPAWLGVSAAGALSGTPGAGDVGTNVFTVRVTDLAGAFSNATLGIVVLPNSLRHYYLFEANANDSVEADDGVVAGSPVYTNGMTGQALVLDGATNYVTLPDPLPALVFSNITVAAWVWWNGGNQWQRLFDFGNDTSHYLFLSPRSGGNTLRFAINNGAGEQMVETTQLPSNQWMHVAVTLGGNTATLYVNGVAKATNTVMTIHPCDFVPAHNLIGDSQFSTDPLLGGWIDDFRIYNYALGAGEMAALYTDTLTTARGLPVPPAKVSAVPGYARVSLSWGPSIVATGYVVKRATASGGPYLAVNNTSSTTTLDTGLTKGVTYYYTVVATNALGNSYDSVTVSATPMANILPPPWQHLDIGAVGAAGDAAYSNAVFAAEGSGTDIWGTVDQFHYVYQPLSSNGTIIVRVMSLDNVNSWAKAGVMIRETLTEGSKHVSLVATPTTVNGVAMQNRATTGGASVTVAQTTGNSSSLPRWLRLVRLGNVITASRSSGGSSWTTMASVTNTMAKAVYIGMPVTSHTNGLLASAVYSNVTVTLYTPAIPTGLVARAASRRVELAWGSSSGATGYVVKRSTTSGGPYSSLTVTAILTCTDTVVSADTSYYYVVCATNAFGESAPSEEVTGAPADWVEDGIAPAWRLSYFGVAETTNATSAATADPDGDGMMNWEEFVAGTDPTNKASVLRVDSVLATDGGSNLVLSFPTVSGRTYRLEWSTNLVSSLWTNVAGVITGTGSSMPVTNVPTLPFWYFYRIRVSP